MNIVKPKMDNKTGTKLLKAHLRLKRAKKEHKRKHKVIKSDKIKVISYSSKK